MKHDNTSSTTVRIGGVPFTVITHGDRLYLACNGKIRQLSLAMVMIAMSRGVKTMIMEVLTQSAFDPNEPFVRSNATWEGEPITLATTRQRVNALADDLSQRIQNGGLSASYCAGLACAIEGINTAIYGDD